MINGVINVYKEKGYTSHDVVAKMRGIFKQKRIGHTGTLDPDAEGVLPVCLGRATRLCDMLTDRTKTYRAVLLLGRETDTQDAGGETLKTAEVNVTPDEVRKAVLKYLGGYDQIPPMYSALKVNGQKLVDLARRGLTVERKARHILIDRISVEEISLPRVTFTVDCSKGTYIRTLCADIGRDLKCGGCMESLLRLRVGMFELKDARKLAEISAEAAAGKPEAFLIPTDLCLAEYPPVHMLPEADRFLHNGNPVPFSFAAGEFQALPEVPFYRIYDSTGLFIGLYKDSGKETLTPEKIFAATEGNEET